MHSVATALRKSLVFAAESGETPRRERIGGDAPISRQYGLRSTPTVYFYSAS
jgi:hypothetical protein